MCKKIKYRMERIDPKEIVWFKNLETPMNELKGQVAFLPGMDDFFIPHTWIFKNKDEALLFAVDNKMPYFIADTLLFMPLTFIRSVISKASAIEMLVDLEKGLREFADLPRI